MKQSRRMLGNEDRMKISTKGRYAVRVMLDLALNNNGECIKVKEIAARQGISEKYLEQIIAVLNKAGYVKSVRGAQGGYRIAKDPADYTVGNDPAADGKGETHRSHSQSAVLLAGSRWLCGQRRGRKAYCILAAKKALQDHMERVGLKGEVLDSKVPSTYKIDYEIDETPLISI
mgnify:CR=1 FL=1